jgi:hypothetical protein
LVAAALDQAMWQFAPAMEQTRCSQQLHRLLVGVVEVLTTVLQAHLFNRAHLVVLAAAVHSVVL